VAACAPCRLAAGLSAGATLARSQRHRRKSQCRSARFRCQAWHYLGAILGACPVHAATSSQGARQARLPHLLPLLLVGTGAVAHVPLLEPRLEDRNRSEDEVGQRLNFYSSRPSGHRADQKSVLAEPPVEAQQSLATSHQHASTALAARHPRGPGPAQTNRAWPRCPPPPPPPPLSAARLCVEVPMMANHERVTGFYCSCLVFVVLFVM